jgi:Tfp pilus assembly protein PilX
MIKKRGWVLAVGIFFLIVLSLIVIAQEEDNKDD